MAAEDAVATTPPVAEARATEASHGHRSARTRLFGALGRLDDVELAHDRHRVWLLGST